MRRTVITGLVLATLLGIASSAQAGVRFSFGFGVGRGGFYAGFRPYHAYSPFYVYRPYVYSYAYAPYPYFAPPVYYPYRYYYRPAPVPRVKDVYRGRVYSNYVPRRYYRYR